MAFTVTKKQHSVGSVRMVTIAVTADATSGTFDSGLSVIDGGTMTAKSAATIVGGFGAKFNQSAGVAANGKINITGVTSGDDLEIVCFGR